MTKKFILIKTLEEGRDALRQNNACFLVSDPSMIALCGVRFFSVLFEKLRGEFTQTTFQEGVTCGNDPGLVFATLRHKIPFVFFDAKSPLWPKIESLVQNKGLTLYPQDFLQEE